MRRRSSKLRPTSRQPQWEPVPGVPRLYKRVGAKRVGFYFKPLTGRGSTTLASAPIGDREAIDTAELTAKRLALDLLNGAVTVGSTGDMISRFQLEKDPTHFLSQTKDATNNRKAMYARLTRTFGETNPRSLKQIHSYQYLEMREIEGAPERGNKEMAMMSTICHWGVRVGLMDANPFVGMKKTVTDRIVRDASRRQIVRFYLWAMRQSNQAFRTMGCAAMFAYLTGFRPSEVRPIRLEALQKDGVRITGAKRKKGETRVLKVREWSSRLRLVVARAQKRKHPSAHLFGGTRRPYGPYTRSGWNSVWQDAMAGWLGTKDAASTTAHPEYFALQDVRPAAITTKLKRNRTGKSYCEAKGKH